MYRIAYLMILKDFQRCTELTLFTFFLQVV